MSYNIQHTVQGATVGHIHHADGKVIVTFPNIKTPATGAVTLTEDLPAGAYVNIHSTKYPAGIMQGIINTQHVWSVPLAGAAPQGSGVAIMSVDPTAMTLTYFIKYVGTTGTGMHVHTGAVGVNGPVSIALPGTASPVNGMVPITKDQLTALMSGNTYLNIHSEAFPNGAIRGQNMPNNSYLVIMTGAQESANGDEAAVGLSSVIQVVDTVYYAVVHNVAGVTAGHFHQGAFGKDGGVVAALTKNSQTSFAGMQSIPAATLMNLLALGVYINLHSTNHNDGAIRGQVGLIYYEKCDANGNFIVPGSAPTPSNGKEMDAQMTCISKENCWCGLKNTNGLNIVPVCVPSLAACTMYGYPGVTCLAPGAPPVPTPTPVSTPVPSSSTACLATQCFCQSNVPGYVGWCATNSALCSSYGASYGAYCKCIRHSFVLGLLSC